MSRKRFNPLEDPLMAFSSNEDEVETSIGEGEGHPSMNKPETALAAADFETKRIDPVVKPEPPSVVTKTNDSDHDVKKLKSSETDGGASSTDVEKVSGEDEKKSGGGEETKKTFWSEEDEIALLQGLIDYETVTGASLYADINGAYQFVKKSISFDVSNVQFCEKLRTLIKGFEYNPAKRKNGEEPAFAKPHDRKVSVIWGPNRKYNLDNPSSKPGKRGRRWRVVRW